jgi:hypothetical protein
MQFHRPQPSPRTFLATLCVASLLSGVVIAQETVSPDPSAGPHYVTATQSTEDEATTTRVRRALDIVGRHASADSSVLCVGAGAGRVVGGYPVERDQTLVVVSCGSSGHELWMANHTGRMSFRAVWLNVPSQRAHVQLERRRFIQEFSFDTNARTATHRATAPGGVEISTYVWMGGRGFVLDQHFAGPCEASAECREELGVVYTRAGHGR